MTKDWQERSRSFVVSSPEIDPELSAARGGFVSSISKEALAIGWHLNIDLLTNTSSTNELTIVEDSFVEDDSEGCAILFQFSGMMEFCCSHW